VVSTDLFGNEPSTMRHKLTTASVPEFCSQVNTFYKSILTTKITCETFNGLRHYSASSTVDTPNQDKAVMGDLVPEEAPHTLDYI